MRARQHHHCAMTNMCKTRAECQAQNGKRPPPRKTKSSTEKALQQRNTVSPSDRQTNRGISSLKNMSITDKKSIQDHIIDIAVEPRD